MIRILISDGRAIERRGLEQIIRDAPGMAVVRGAGDGQDTLRAVLTHACDVVVLGLPTLGMGRWEVLKAIRRLHPGLPVIVLTAPAEEQYVARTLRAGASGFLTTDAAPGELVAAIRTVASGHRYVPARLVEVLAIYIERGSKDSLGELLSDREYEILQLLVRGMRNRQVAAALCISPKTVSTHCVRIRRKLRLARDVELVHYARTHGLGP